MEKRFNRHLHGNLGGSIRQRRGFFKSNRARKAFFWSLVGDCTAYFIVFYIIGYVLGAGLVVYVFTWPLLKAFLGL